jgi:hypothetical protein
MRPSARASIAVTIGLVVALHVTLHGRIVPAWGFDVDQTWHGLRALWAQENPYAVIGPHGQRFVWPWPLYYPVPALLLAAPVAWLPLPLFRPAFLGVSAAWLAWGLGREDPWRMALLSSGPMLAAVSIGTWEPALVAAGLTPGALALYLAKPNEGLALAVGSQWPPSRPMVLGGAAALALLGGTVLVWPWWPLAWWAAVHSAGHFDAPIRHVSGVLVVAALWKWRRPEARLLVLLACVPQTLFPQAALPLALIPRTRREVLGFVVLSYLPIAVEYWGARTNGFVAQTQVIGTALTLALYLPCTLMVLRRPNRWTDLPTTGSPKSPPRAD